MTPGNPWWYSGDDGVEQDGPAERDAAESRRAAEDGTSRPTQAPEPPPDEPETSSGGTDWSALIVGAQRMVDWATERVMAPHAEHADPREYPTCVVCRTMVLLGEVPAAETGSPAGDAETGQQDRGGPEASPAIQWIPIHGEHLEP